MATAPPPGAGKRAQAKKATQQIANITVAGRTVHLAINNVPMKERLIVRKATGLPFEQFAAGEQSVGLDTLQIWYWLGRRAEGDAFLTLDQALEEWPEDPNDFSLEIETPDDEETELDHSDPESSGPVS